MRKNILHLCADLGSDSWYYQQDEKYNVICIGEEIGVENMGGKSMEALMCLFGIAIGAGIVTGLWLVAKFAARHIDGEYDE